MHKKVAPAPNKIQHIHNHSLLWIGPAIYQDFSDEAETALPNPSFARK
jgi:hypothetical protein